MTEKIKCSKCKEMREPDWFHESKAQPRGKKYYCKSCVKNARTVNKYKDELFKRKSSECDSKLADKRLADELKEVWEQ